MSELSSRPSSSRNATFCSSGLSSPSSPLTTSGPPSQTPPESASSSGRVKPAAEYLSAIASKSASSPSLRITTIPARDCPRISHSDSTGEKPSVSFSGCAADASDDTE